MILEEQPDAVGLVFIMHGLGGHMRQPHIETFANAYREKGFTVVRFDTTNTFGESDGSYEDATITNYYEDLEDVIGWAATQPWYQEPFWLEGHSLGGICTALFAERHPEKIKALAPISTVVSNRFIADVYTEDEVKSWKETGYLIKPSVSQPGVTKKLKWAFYEDRLKYDLLAQADRLTMPVLLMVGENDTRTPLPHQQALFDALPAKKELHIIKGAEHTFIKPEHLEEIRKITSAWIEKYL
ncbi:alpha/beta hydrolase [Candidatus Falkowbacteria bacterium]|nr:alpha/beta hydrolase [Candidatus Falkowbacteria bacterium]